MTDVDLQLLENAMPDISILYCMTFMKLSCMVHLKKELTVCQKSKDSKNYPTKSPIVAAFLIVNFSNNVLVNFVSFMGVMI